MSSWTLPLLAWVFAFLLMVAALWLGNLRRVERHRQVASPAIALAYVLLCSYAYTEYLQPILMIVDSLIASVQQAALNLQGIDLANWLPRSLVVNLLALAGFFLFKGLARIIVWLARMGSKAWRFASQRYRLGEGAAEAAPAVAQFSFAYELVPGEGVVLARRWIYPRLAFLGFAVVAFAQLAATAGLQLSGSWLSVPAFSGLPLLICLEIAWFLGGPVRAGEEKVSGTRPGPTTVGDYVELWRQYQALWPEHVLAAASLEIDATPDQQPRMAEIESELRKGHSVLVTANELTALLPMLARHVEDAVAAGGTVVVLAAREELACVLAETLSRPTGTHAVLSPLIRVVAFDRFLRDRNAADVLVATADRLLHTGALRDDWFRRTRAVVVPDLDSAFARLPAIRALLHQLRVVAGPDVQVQHVFLGHERLAPEPAVHRNFPVRPREFRLGPATSKRLHVVLWRAEANEWFQNRLLNAAVGRHFGAEVVLGLPAWKAGVGTIALYDVDDVPWREQREEVDKFLSDLRKEWRIDPKVDGTAATRIGAPDASSVIAVPGVRGCALVRDSRGNLGAAIHDRMAKATEELLLHVVSPSYLLREYFCGNIDYFFDKPLRPLSPLNAPGIRATASDLWNELCAGEIEEGVILPMLRDVLPETAEVATGLDRLFRKAYGLETRRDGLLQTRLASRFDAGTNRFTETAFFSLAPMANDLRRGRGHLVLRDSDGAALAFVERDQFYQQYLPGQIHTFGGRPYLIGRVDGVIGEVGLDLTSPPGEFGYRSDLRVSIDSIRASTNSELHRRIRRGDWEIECELCECDFQVSADGFFTFKRGISLANQEHDYTMFRDPIPIRDYPKGRAFRFSLTPPSGFAVDQPRAALTLATLFDEVLETLLPETNRFVHFGTLMPGVNLQTPHLAELLPTFVAPVGDPPNLRAISMVAVEDALEDMGALQCLFLHWEYVAEVLFDFLAWRAEPPRESAIWKAPGDAAPEFLAYGLSSVPAEFDLDATFAILEAIGFGTGQDSLHRQRRARLEGATEARVEAESGAERECDFCGRTLTPAEFERLADGRERCVKCRDSAVDDVGKLEGVYREARAFLVNEFEIDLRTNLGVRFASAHEIARDADDRFIPTSGFDPRAIGRAIQCDGNCTVLIENGQPYHMTLATAVHELTHVWQFDNLDFERMVKESELLLIEGHATWAEVECLRRKDLAPEYWQHTTNRTDVYGKGYREIAKLCGETECLENPFRFLSALYQRAL